MFKAPECLFDPELIGKELKGIDHAVHDSIMKTEIDMRKDLYANIVLSGGTTMIKLLNERLEKELTILNEKLFLILPLKHGAIISQKFGHRTLTQENIA
jgi:actin-related protein